MLKGQVPVGDER